MNTFLIVSLLSALLWLTPPYQGQVPACGAYAVQYAVKVSWDVDVDAKKIYANRPRKDVHGMSIPEALELAGVDPWEYIRLDTLGVPPADAVRNALKGGNVVIVSLPWNDAYEYGNMKAPPQRNLFHAVVIVDESEEGFIFANWFGSKWGTNGYGVWPHGLGANSYDMYMIRRMP